MNNENGLTLSVNYERTVLENNRIVNNTHWGIIADGGADWIQFKGDNFPAPAGEPANGIGNLVALRAFTVYARDGLGKPLNGINVSIDSGCMDRYNPGDEILVFTDTRTDIDGDCTFTNLFSYVMIDGYNKIYCEEYTLRARIRLTDDITLEQNVKVDMKNTVNHTFVFQLPNFYFDDDELLLDPEEEWTVRSEDLHSRSRNSSYLGETLTGRVKASFLRGRLTWRDRRQESE